MLSLTLATIVHYDDGVGKVVLSYYPSLVSATGADTSGVCGISPVRLHQG